MAIKLSSKGGGGALKLAVDLDYPSVFSQSSSNLAYVTVTGINATGGLTQVLNLSGKFVIGYLQFSSLTVEPITIKATLDGTVIWNDTFTPVSTGVTLLGFASGFRDAFVCDTSFVLEVQTTTDTSITFSYDAKPIQ